MKRLTALMLMVAALPLAAAEAKIYKVLPQFVDREGRHALSPSLYERDAYQAVLQKDPLQRGGMQFAVHWKAKKSSTLKLRIDMRGTKEDQPTNVSVEMPVKPPRFLNRWSALMVRGDSYTRLGDLRSWRVTLLDGDQTIAEQKSFLW